MTLLLGSTRYQNTKSIQNADLPSQNTVQNKIENITCQSNVHISNTAFLTA